MYLPAGFLGLSSGISNITFPIKFDPISHALLKSPPPILKNRAITDAPSPMLTNVVVTVSYILSLNANRSISTTAKQTSKADPVVIKENAEPPRKAFEKLFMYPTRPSSWAQITS